MTRIVDSHQHFWRTEAQEQPWRTSAHDALARDFEPTDLDPELRAVGVDATIVMQSVDETAENRRLAEYGKWSRIVGVVGWIPLRDPYTASRELAEMRIPKLCGVRSLIADDPLEWLTSPGSLSFFRDLADRDLTWDVAPITAEQIRRVIKLAARIPELRIVVDHLGRPPIHNGGWEPWATNMKELATSPSVAVKVSVGIDALTAWETWDNRRLEPYIRLVCESYGAQRIMLASNWPVILLRASYSEAWTDLSSLVAAELPDPGDQADVLGGTATRWYRLKGLDVPVRTQSDHQP